MEGLKGAPDLRMAQATSKRGSSTDRRTRRWRWLRYFTGAAGDTPIYSSCGGIFTSKNRFNYDWTVLSERVLQLCWYFARHLCFSPSVWALRVLSDTCRWAAVR